LSDASKQTLVFQGGKMNELEALKFEQNESFDVILKMRDWDDLAKDKSLNLALKSNDLLNKYKIMLNKLIELK
jgi:2-amino-1-hydroxyethylphosphonate dioxygenase (glycine-forming)